MHVFYHVYQRQNWIEIMTRQIGTMRRSKLLENCELIIGTVGEESAMQTVLRQLGVNAQVVGCQIGNEEHTLDLLWRFAMGATKNAEEDPALLYLHAKGVTHRLNSQRPIHDWCALMEYHLIEQWDVRRYEIMTGLVDVSGINLLLPREVKDTTAHFSGNFFWTSIPHVRRLPSPVEWMTPKTDRRNPESWAAQRHDTRLLNVYWSGVDHYYSDYPRHRYASQYLE